MEIRKWRHKVVESEEWTFAIKEAKALRGP
jgi:hypothetical protein